MKFNRSIMIRVVAIIALITSLTVLSNKIQADTGNCGGVIITLPFTDVMASPFFCQIAAAYYSGLTNGTTATTYDPTQTVTREQMAAFITRTQDAALRRGSRRAALNQWWTTKPHYFTYSTTDGMKSLGITQINFTPTLTTSDGDYIWVAASGDAQHSGEIVMVSNIQGEVIQRHLNDPGIRVGAPLIAMGKLFFTAVSNNIGRLRLVDLNPIQGSFYFEVATGIGSDPTGIAFDGDRIWITSTSGSVSIVTPSQTTPWPVTTITTGFSIPKGILYDGTSIWVTDAGDHQLKKLDSNGNIVQAVTVGSQPENLIFDGTNLWIPSRGSNSLTVVRASTGAILATLTGNGLNGPRTAAFDGQRILVTNFLGDSVSLWKAVDLSPIGTFQTGAGSQPYGACSDGKDFWVTLSGVDKLARF